MKFYYYIFYKLYKFTENLGVCPTVRAFCLIILLDLAFLGSLLNYYTILTGDFINFLNNGVWTYLVPIIVVVINFFLLLKGNKKNEIVKRFDRMPQNKNILGSIIVFFCMLFLIILFIVSLFKLDSMR